MSCYFEKCCFDAQVVGTQKECDKLSCDGKHTEFSLLFHKINNEYFHCLNRKQLDEYWECIVKDQEILCSEKCHDCVVYKFLTEAHDGLKRSYFFHKEKTCLINLFHRKFLLMLSTKLINLFLELKLEKQ